MDPLSLATACVTLIDAAAKTSTGIITFVHSYHGARSDLITMNNELSELRTVLELLKDTVVKTIDSVIPERLQARVVSIIDNCVAVVTKIDDILDRHRGGLGAAKWAVAGKMEIAGLRTGLEAHRQSLHLALELVSITLVKTVKDDTAVIRMEVHDMRETLTRFRRSCRSWPRSGPSSLEMIPHPRYLVRSICFRDILMTSLHTVKLSTRMWSGRTLIPVTGMICGLLSWKSGLKFLRYLRQVRTQIH